MTAALNNVGVLFQVVGVAMAGFGLWKTWHEFAEGDRFFGPIVDRARATGRRVVASLRRAVRRIMGRPAGQVVGAGAAVGSAAGFMARGRIQFPEASGGHRRRDGDRRTG